MRELICFVEGSSEKELLRGLLPRLLPSGLSFRIFPFSGKSDLESQLVRRLRGYQNPEARFLVMRDQDSGPCRRAKSRLVDLCAEAGRPDAVVRIACHEVETFFLADLAAVEAGLGLKKLAKLQAKEKFRSPDHLESPSEELERLTDGLYQKVGGSRAIAPHLDLDNTRSQSFEALVKAIRQLAVA